VKDSNAVAKRDQALDQNVYNNHLGGANEMQAPNQRQQDQRRPSDQRGYRTGAANQATMNLTQSYGAKLPLKIQLKNQSMTSSRQSKHSANSMEAAQAQRAPLRRGHQINHSSHQEQQMKEMVIQQNYDCSPKLEPQANNGHAGVRGFNAVDGAALEEAQSQPTS